MPVLDEKKRRKLQRKLQRRGRDAQQFGQQADDQIERLLIRRFDRLVSVRRFVALFILLFAVLFFYSVLQIRALSPHYQALLPVAGGMYSEGLVGTFTNANPLYASGAADRAVSRLVFSGLFKFDADNNLVGDLAQSWKADERGTRYTITLRRDLVWHDGQPFDASDVVFTYQTIQNAESRSSLYTSWQGIKVSKQDAYTVNFDLPNSLSAFPYSLVNGIVPQHLLKDTPPSQMRSASFNTDPIGTGPFVWRFVEVTGGSAINREQRIILAPFEKYWAGKPKLDGFSIIAYNDEQKLVKAFEDKKLNAISGLEALPDSLKKNTDIEVYNTPLNSVVMAFFNNSRPILTDLSVRRALVQSVDRKQVIPILNYPAKLVDSALLKTQLGYDPNITQFPYSLEQASQLLDNAGWTRGADGQRVNKDGQKLTLNLSSQDTREYTAVAQLLQKQWAAMGVETKVRFFSGDDLQSTIIAGHDYDILLYGISLGVDPDVFAYWHSSQAPISSQGHLNLSEYKSVAADQALEAGRTRADPGLRALKYQPFLSAWVNDAPALALYQPSVMYITRGPVYGYQRQAANSGVDRFYNVDQWMIREQRQDRPK